MKHLDVEKRTLNWEERLQIALDISHGLEYLHDGVSKVIVKIFSISAQVGTYIFKNINFSFSEQAVPAVIHRDLKSANILLDHLYRAKVILGTINSLIILSCSLSSWFEETRLYS